MSAERALFRASASWADICSSWRRSSSASARAATAAVAVPSASVPVLLNEPRLAVPWKLGLPCSGKKGAGPLGEGRWLPHAHIPKAARLCVPSPISRLTRREESRPRLNGRPVLQRGLGSSRPPKSMLALEPEFKHRASWREERFKCRPCATRTPSPPAAAPHSAALTCRQQAPAKRAPPQQRCCSFWYHKLQLYAAIQQSAYMHLTGR